MSVHRQELLRGPLFYVLIMTAVTVVFWRDSPVGMMVLSLMCGGDGLADIIGRKYGKAKLPFNKAKSWAGSLAMFTGTMKVFRDVFRPSSLVLQRTFAAL